MTSAEAHAVLRGMLKYWSNQDDDGPSNAEATAAVFTVLAQAEEMRVALNEARDIARRYYRERDDPRQKRDADAIKRWSP